MNPDKFKSVAIKVDTYNKLREMSDNGFPMPVSMSKTTEFLVENAFEAWNKRGGGKFDFNPYPGIKIEN